MGDGFFFHYNGLCQRIYPSALDLVCYFYVIFGVFEVRNMQYVYIFWSQSIYFMLSAASKIVHYDSLTAHM